MTKVGVLCFLSSLFIHLNRSHYRSSLSVCLSFYLVRANLKTERCGKSKIGVPVFGSKVQKSGQGYLCTVQRIAGQMAAQNVGPLSTYLLIYISVRTNRVVRWRERSAAQASGPSVPLSSRQPADSVVGRTPDSTHVTVVSSRSQHRPVYDRELDCIRPMLATTEVPNTLSFSASLFGCIFLFFFAFLLSASARFI